MKAITSNYVKSQLTSPIKVTGIYTVHYFKYGRNFHFKGERHNFWEMVFLDSGSAKLQAEDQEITLNQGEAYFHKPNELHTIHTEEKFANSVIISFECKSRAIKLLAGKVFVFDEYQKSLLSKIITETKLNYADKLNEVYLLKMTKKENSLFGGEQIIKNCIELLLISLLRTDNAQKVTTTEETLNFSSNNIVSSVKNILYSKLESATNINLNEISFQLGFSKSYVKSQFKKQTGTSIIQFYINLKIDKAKKMLSQQKYSVSEIADSLGFSSVYYFSRQFKMHTDMSPTEYVNSIKADNVL